MTGAGIFLLTFVAALGIVARFGAAVQHGGGLKEEMERLLAERELLLTDLLRLQSQIYELHSMMMQESGGATVVPIRSPRRGRADRR